MLIFLFLFLFFFSLFFFSTDFSPASCIKFSTLRPLKHICKNAGTLFLRNFSLPPSNREVFSYLFSFLWKCVMEHILNGIIAASKYNVSLFYWGFRSPDLGSGCGTAALRLPFRVVSHQLQLAGGFRGEVDLWWCFALLLFAFFSPQHIPCCSPARSPDCRNQYWPKNFFVMYFNIFLISSPSHFFFNQFFHGIFVYMFFFFFSIILLPFLPLTLVLCIYHILYVFLPC